MSPLSALGNRVCLIALVVSFGACSVGGIPVQTAAADQVRTLGEIQRHLDAGEWDAAFTAGTQFLAQHPDDEQALRMLIRAATELRRYPAAIDAYQRLLALGRASEDDRFQLARLLGWERRFTESLTLLAALRGAHPENPDYAVEEAQVLGWQGRYQESIERFQAVLAVHPERRDAREGLAAVLSWDGQYEAALAEYEALARDFPDEIAYPIAIARVHSWAGELDTARRLYLEILARHPDNPDALFGVGQTYHWAGDSRRAKAYYERAVSVAPEHQDARAALRAVWDEARPNLDLGYVFLSDSDNIENTRIPATYSFTPALSTRLSFLHLRTHSASTLGTTDCDTDLLRVSTFAGGGLSVSAGVGQVSTPLQTGTTWSLSLAGRKDRTGGSLTWDRSLYLDTPTTVLNRIGVSAVAASLWAQSRRGSKLALEYQFGEFFDGNRKGTVSVSIRTPVRKAKAWSWGLKHYQFRFARQLNLGYWNPLSYSQESVSLEYAHRRSQTGAVSGFEVGVNANREFGGEWRTGLALNASIGWRAGPRNALSLAYSYFNTDLSDSSVYHSSVWNFSYGTRF